MNSPCTKSFKTWKVAIKKQHESVLKATPINPVIRWERWSLRNKSRRFVNQFSMIKLTAQACEKLSGQWRPSSTSFRAAFISLLQAPDSHSTRSEREIWKCDKQLHNQLLALLEDKLDFVDNTHSAPAGVSEHKSHLGFRLSIFQAAHWLCNCSSYVDIFIFCFVAT